jgi:hypothetical protein
MAAILVWQVILGHSWGKYSITNGNVVGWTVFLWIVYFRLLTVRIVTDVDSRGLVVGLRGLWRKFRVPAADISAVDVITFDAERDYGGYGARSIRTGTAYIAQSGEGVRIQLAKGSLLIISSRRASELAAALRRIAKA